MNERDQLLTEQYLRNALNEADRLSFEKRLAEDAQFKEEVQLHARALEAVRLHGRDALKQKLAERPLVPSRRKLLPLWITLAVLFVGILLYYGVQKGGNNQRSTTQGFSQDTLVKKAHQDTLLRASNPDSIQKTVLPETTRFAQLYTEHYTRFEDDQTRRAAQRGPLRSGEPGIASFLYHYQRKEYKEALAVFAQLSEEDRTDGNMRFYYANALMAVGKTATAAGVLDQIQPEDSDFSNEIHWYAALCALKQGNLQKAKSHLKSLSTTNSKAYKAKAIALLKELPQ